MATQVQTSVSYTERFLYSQTLAVVCSVGITSFFANVFSFELHGFVQKLVDLWSMSLQAAILAAFDYTIGALIVLVAHTKVGLPLFVSDYFAISATFTFYGITYHQLYCSVCFEERGDHGLREVCYEFGSGGVQTPILWIVRPVVEILNLTSPPEDWSRLPNRLGPKLSRRASNLALLPFGYCAILFAISTISGL